MRLPGTQVRWEAGHVGIQAQARGTLALRRVERLEFFPPGITACQ
jgi:hypothetical protein